MRPTTSAATSDRRGYYILQRRPRQLSSQSRQRGPRSAYLGHEVFISLVDAGTGADPATICASLAST